MSKQNVRCAIYTRKSSEEGLEQEFNSLHAQREAAEAYIRSQKHEGWEVITTAYDDGGYSGGSMDRPGLKQLLQDIRDNRVDVVVVYKIDRLTRSLFDFAKMVEVFDTHKVSFVSITQSFNTTTSMGRLTLNVLLSFAQFEREVTSERIRDKIAASKKKGMWMGGSVPLGYDAQEKKLVINEAEARTVQTIFELYDNLGSIKLLKTECDRLSLTTKSRPPKYVQLPFWPGHLYRILINPAYIGLVAHKDQVHKGEHAAIISRELWDKVQQKLLSRTPGSKSGAAAKEPSLLAGIMFDGNGERMTPSHAVKNGKRYRYYLSQNLNNGQGKGIRITAHEIEDMVLTQVAGFLKDRAQIIKLLNIADESLSHINAVLNKAVALGHQLESGTTIDRRPILLELIKRIEITAIDIRIEVKPLALRKLLELHVDVESNDGLHVLISQTEIRRLGNETKLVIASNTSQKIDHFMVKAIVRAHRWFEMLKNHQVKSLAEIAEQENLPRNYISGLLPLVFLAPDITQAILDGRQLGDLRLDELLKQAQMHLKWIVLETIDIAHHTQ